MTRLIIVAILLWAGTAWGQDAVTLPAPLPKHFFTQDGRILIPPAYIESGTTTMPVDFEKQRLIRQWAASGEICRVLGHQWQDASEWFRFDKYDGKFILWDQQKRKCSMCGKTETKKEVWE